MEWSIIIIIIGLIATVNENEECGIPLLIWGIILLISAIIDEISAQSVAPENNSSSNNNVVKKEIVVENQQPRKKKRRGRKKKSLIPQTSNENSDNIKITIPSHEKSKATHQLADKTPAAILYNKVEPQKDYYKKYEPAKYSPPQKPIELEEYVIIKFDNYYREYTYLAPKNRVLKANERVKIATNQGPKMVTVVKGNYKSPRKTDMMYKRLDVL